jgi:hypothetical protein
MDCLCLIDFMEIKFVYVNRRCLPTGNRDWRSNELLMSQVETRIAAPQEDALFGSTIANEFKKGATMKKVAIYAGLIALLASPLAAPASTASQSSQNANGNAVTVTGRVSCARFGTGSVSPRKGMSVAQTIQYCVVFQHSEYTLVAGKQIYKLSGDGNLLAKMSGQTVTVAGQLSPEPTDVQTYALMGTVAVAKVIPSKE